MNSLIFNSKNRRENLNTLVTLPKVMENSELNLIREQNKIVISLLGRLVFPEDKIKDIISKKGKKPQQMIKAYNLCTGNLTTKQISDKVSGITSRALNIATEKWEESGIVTIMGERGKGKDIKPIHLYKISEDMKND